MTKRLGRTLGTPLSAPASPSDAFRSYYSIKHRARTLCFLWLFSGCTVSHPMTPTPCISLSVMAIKTDSPSTCIHTNSVTNMDVQNADFWDTIWDIKWKNRL